MSDSKNVQAIVIRLKCGRSLLEKCLRIGKLSKKPSLNRVCLLPYANICVFSALDHLLKPYQNEAAPLLPTHCPFFPAVNLLMQGANECKISRKTLFLESGHKNAKRVNISKATLGILGTQTHSFLVFSHYVILFSYIFSKSSVIVVVSNQS